jgi:hypothetical protein
MSDATLDEAVDVLTDAIEEVDDDDALYHLRKAAQHVEVARQQREH